jgi:L-threonylcarbamoyladenylate synthase
VTAGLKIDAAAVEQAAALLAAGRLVAFPTETVYGLGADADNVDAVRSIFAAKGRPADHPVIVHVLDADAIGAWSTGAPEAARRLAKAFWPGPLTLVLTRSARAHDALTGGQASVGLRCPSHPWARALLAAFAARRADASAALAAPSANSFGRISPTTAAHVRADLGEKPSGRVDLILDGGPSPVGIESTIVDLSGPAPRLLRHGAITRRQIEETIGCVVADAGGDAPRASGGLKSHYAPRTRLELLPATVLPARINALRGTRLAVLAPAAALLDWPADVVLRLVAPANAAEYARRLYALLHQLDGSGAARILVAAPPQGEAWDAVHDRLRRAAAAAESSDEGT